MKKKKIILTPLKPVLNPKPSKGEGEALIIHDECQQEQKNARLSLHWLRRMRLKRSLT